MANLRLNFLSLNTNQFTFRAFIKKREEDEKKEEGIFFYQLRRASGTEKEGVWVSFAEREGFTEEEINSSECIDLTKRYLTNLLHNSLQRQGIPYPFYYRSRFADERVEFVVEETQKGKRVVFLSPYYLEVEKKFGFLIDFKFIKKPEELFDKEVQRLSLSLDNNYKSNRNFYSDKFRIIQNFLAKAFNSFKVLSQEDSLELKKEMIEVPVFLLNKKEYIFSNNNTSHSQFQGIKNYGPYIPLKEEVLFVFLFEERFKSFANELYLSLIGKSNPGTFTGFESMFKLHIGVENVRKVTIEGTQDTDLLNAIQEVKSYQEAAPQKKVIGIYIEDYSAGNEVEASHSYYFLKYHFIKEDIPLQVINYNKLGEKNSLKWSTSNVALAMFSKLGGIPWIVKPSNNNCLILGVGSSHKIDEETKEVTKYFAYTVCLDSSGLYKSLEILADETHKDNYLEKLQNNLIALLSSGKFNQYSSCVLHLPFKIKRNEINAISNAIKKISNMEFVVIKINLENKFFGYSDHNTLVPYESSFLKLSNREYLVWFEGLHYGKEVVDKKLSNPVHIQFLNISETGYDERKYLQDVLNLSGANWRGFNAKSVPISIYYSQIITKYTKAFEELTGYDESLLSNERPWFL